MNSTNPLPSPSPEPAGPMPETPIRWPDKLMLYLLVGLFFLFGVLLLGDLMAGLLR